MKRGTLKKPDGTDLISFNIPDDLSEVPLTRLINFIVESRDLDDDKPATAITVMAKAVSAFLDVDIHTLLFASAGAFNAPVKSFSSSISSLYGHIVKMIGDFKPALMTPDYSFDYQGETYSVPTIIKQAIDGEFMLPDLSVSEVVEVAEVARFKQQVTANRADPDGKLAKKFNDMVAAQIKENHGLDTDGYLTKAGERLYKSEVERLGDADGSLMLTYYLKTLAILCRKKDETLPFEDSVREMWIQNRAFSFINLDAATALNVDFFLTSISESSEQRPAAVGFLKNHCFAVVAATRLKNVRRSTKPSTIRRKFSKKSVGVK